MSHERKTKWTAVAMMQQWIDEAGRQSQQAVRTMEGFDPGGGVIS